MNYLTYLYLRTKQEIKLAYLELQNKYLDWKLARANDKILRRIATDETEEELIDMMSEGQKQYLVDYKVIPKAKEKELI